VDTVWLVVRSQVRHYFILTESMPLGFNLKGNVDQNVA
jgi:hypothetical protein